MSLATENQSGGFPHDVILSIPRFLLRELTRRKSKIEIPVANERSEYSNALK
jgi:hypothetical protein